VLAETYPALKLKWGRGAPAPGLPADGFSMRCDSELRLAESGNYQFTASADDAVRVYVNDALLINEWHVRGGAYRAGAALGAGPQRVRVEYYDAAGSAALHVSYALSYDGWKARYYASATREGDPLLIRNDGTQAMLSVHFDSAGAAAPANTAAVQWEREIAFEPGVRYQIDTDLDGQALLYVGGDGDAPSYLLGQGRSTLTLPALSGKRLLQIIYTRPPSGGGGHAEVAVRVGR
jgi:PA14 domain